MTPVFFRVKFRLEPWTGNFQHYRVPDLSEGGLKQTLAGCVKSADNEYLGCRFRVKIDSGRLRRLGVELHSTD